MDPIPPALKDRMEVIPLAGYTTEEKEHIAVRYLIPKELDENGLADTPVEFTPASLARIIGEYTRAMVLNLLGGMVFGAVVKAVVAFIAFHFLYFKIFSDSNVLWAVAKLYYAKTTPATVAA